MVQFATQALNCTISSRGVLFFCQTWKIYPKTLSWCEETDSIPPSRLLIKDLSPILWKIIYSLLFYININAIQILSIISVSWKSFGKESTVTLEPRSSTQCWPYHTSPSQCSDHENPTYCTPTLGRLEKKLLQSSTDITNWEDQLQYEPFCKAYFQELEPRHDIFRYYKKLIQICQISDFFNMKWFSLHSTHLTNWNTTHTLTPMNSSHLESQMKRILIQFDR